MITKDPVIDKMPTDEITFSRNEHDELKISGNYNGVCVDQVLVCPAGAIVVFNTKSLNFRVIEAELSDTDLIVEVK